MATEVMPDGARIQKLFDDLETRKSLLTTCTDLYKTLTSDFTSFSQTLEYQSQTLISKLQTLESDSRAALKTLDRRESSLSERESTLAVQIEAQKQLVIKEIEYPKEKGGDWEEDLKSLCRGMDHLGLVKLLMAKRKESNALRNELGSAILGCIDPPRLVLDAVQEFVRQKSVALGTGGGGWSSSLAHRRWACGLVVSGMFPAEELSVGKKSDAGGLVFARSVEERAVRVVQDWKSTVEHRAVGLNGGAAEAAIFLHLMLGFGFQDKFGEGFLNMLVMELAQRKDYAKLYGPVFGDKMEEVIDELVNKNKEIEAVYFAAASGLTERFPPVTLLNSYLRRSKNNATNILTSGNNSAAAVEEADNLELHSLRTVIKCVEENKIEHEFLRLKNLRVRLAKLEKDRAKKKSYSSGGGGSSRPSSKRSENSGGRRRISPPPHSRPSKAAKYSDPYPAYDRRTPVSHTYQSPVPRYSGGPYNYPTPSAYAAPPTATAYDATYGGTHILASAPILQQHYQLPMDGALSYEGHAAYSYDYAVASSASTPTGYGSYDYQAAAAATQPTPYTQ